MANRFGFKNVSNGLVLLCSCPISAIYVLKLGLEAGKHFHFLLTDVFVFPLMSSEEFEASVDVCLGGRITSCHRLVAGIPGATADRPN